MPGTGLRLAALRIKADTAISPLCAPQRASLTLRFSSVAVRAIPSRPLPSHPVFPAKIAGSADDNFFFVSRPEKKKCCRGDICQKTRTGWERPGWDGRLLIH